MRLLTTCLVTGLFLAAIIGSAAAEDRYTQYYMDAADYYNISYETVFDLVETGIEDEDIPVIFYITERTDISVEQLVSYRNQGLYWDEIASEINMAAPDFYVMINAKVKGANFGPIYQEFNSLPKSRWDKIALSHEDIINLVNMKFIYSHHDYSAFDVMAMRDYDRSYVKINQDISTAKAAKIRRQVAARGNDH